MSQRLKILLLSFFLLFLFSGFAETSSLEPYVILQAEHGDLIGDSLRKELNYVSVTSRAQQNDLLAMLLDIHQETNYEIWVRVRGTGSAKLVLFSSNQQIYQENFKITASNWHWIKLHQIIKLNPS